MVELGSDVEFIKKRFEKAKTFRSVVEKIWYVCLCYFYGKQWITWDNSSQVVRDLKQDPKKFYVTSNKIFPTIRQITAKISKQKFSLIAVPTKKEVSDIANANVANKILSHVLENTNVLNKFGMNMYEIILNMFLFSKSYMKVFWNSNLGEIIPESGGLKIGEISTLPLSPFYVYVDPLASSVYDARYVFIVSIRSQEYVEEYYGVNKESISGSNMPSIITRVEDFFNKTGTVREDSIFVVEYYEMPTISNPSGRHIIFCNWEKVVDDELQDENIPLVEFNYFPKLGQQNSINPTEQMIPTQKEYNRLRSEIVKWEKVMMKGKYFIPANSLINPGSITDETGEKVYFDSRYGAPVGVPGVPPPAELWLHLDRLKDEFDEISGIRDISKGIVPAGLRSGQAIMFLQEQDDSNLSPTYNLLADSLSILGNRIVSLAQKHYKEDRLLKVGGEGIKYDIYEFKKEEKIYSKNLDIHVEIGSKLPFSYVAKQQFVMQLVQSGLLQDREKALKLLEMPTEDEIFGEDKYDEVNINRENEIMSKGQPAIVNDFDNHEQHNKGHNNFRKRPSFIELPEEVKKLFFDHVGFHGKFIFLAQKQMIEMQLLAQGRTSKPEAENQNNQNK